MKRNKYFLFSCALLIVSGTFSFTSGQVGTQSGKQYKEVELKLRVFIPSQAVNFKLDLPNALYMYGGDNRGFSYNEGKSRFDKTIVVTMDPNRPPKVKSDYTDKITTTRYFTTEGEHVHGIPLSWWWKLKPGAKPESITQDVPEGISVSSGDDEVFVKFAIHGIGNPFSTRIAYPAPDGDFLIRLFQCGDNIYYKVIGKHDGFPAYEIYLDGEPIYKFMPFRELSPGSMTSILPTDVSIDWTLFGNPSSDKSDIYIFSRLIDIGYNSPYPVQRGDRVVIETRGRVGFGPVAGEAGPEGFPNGELSAYSYYPEVNHGAIMGRIANAGNPIVFKIGKGISFAAPVTGNLILFVNDRAYENNYTPSGTNGFQGCIVITHKQ